MDEFFSLLKKQDMNLRTVAVTVIDGQGRGEKALVSGDRMIWMSDNAGQIARNRDLILASEPGGIIETADSRVYLEPVGSTKQLVLCGGGHVSMPVIRIGKMLGMLVTVIEDRQEFADHALQAGADEVFCGEYEKELEKVPGSSDTYFVIVTRGHASDKECLRGVAGKPHAYIGMIGSHRKNAMVIGSLKEEGISSEVLDQVHAPIGLAIGAKTPEEIAVSILAEIISVKNKKVTGSGYPSAILKGVEKAGEEGLPYILATIVSKTGSGPREAGAKMLVDPNGGIIGTIGGGLGEAQIIEKARELFLKEERTELARIDMTAEQAAAGGMICGGTAEVFLEKL